jgi:hypothetical protein
MENATEISKVISAGNVTGSVNHMSGLDGFTECDLEQELEELLYDPEGDQEKDKKRRTSIIPPVVLSRRPSAIMSPLTRRELPAVPSIDLDKMSAMLV